MKIVVVSGGNYKNLYLNYLCKLQCDLLVINFGVLYDYRVENGYSTKLIKEELLMLAQQNNCVIIAGIYIINKKKKRKAFIESDGEQVAIHNVKHGVKFSFENKKFIIGDRNTCFNGCNIVLLSNKQIAIETLRCSRHKVYVFCDKHGVNCVVNKKLKRKFNKISKIILK